MAISISSLTFSHATDSSSENLGDQTTASISPTNNSLVLVFVGQNKPSGVSAAPTVTGLSMTWTQVATITDSSQKRGTLFRGLANGNSGTLTIAFGGSQQQNIYWGVSQVNGTVTTGTNASDAIVQTQTLGNSNTSTFSMTLSSSPLSVNATFGSLYLNDTPTAGSGFTEVGISGSGHHVEAEYKASSATTTINWTGNPGLAIVAVGVELKALLPAAGALFFSQF